MKLCRNLLIAIFTVSLTFFSVVPVFAGGVTPNVSVVPCEGTFHVLTKTANNLSMVFQRLPRFATPGSTLTVTQSYAVTISNELTFNLIPEFFSYGLTLSFTAGVDYGWYKTNTTNQLLQLVILAIYDNYSVKTFEEISPGSCTYTTTKTYKVYEGSAFDLVP